MISVLKDFVVRDLTVIAHRRRWVSPTVWVLRRKNLALEKILKTYYLFMSEHLRFYTYWYGQEVPIALDLRGLERPLTGDERPRVIQMIDHIL